jgi:hypothetical protein
MATAKKPAKPNRGAFVKGQKKPNQGKRGPNKATVEFRQTVQALLDENRENIGRWLTLVAEGDGTDKGAPDPGKALDLLAKLAEFAAPKLARSEIAGDPSAPVKHEFSWKSG